MTTGFNSGVSNGFDLVGGVSTRFNSGVRMIGLEEQDFDSRVSTRFNSGVRLIGLEEHEFDCSVSNGFDCSVSNGFDSSVSNGFDSSMSDGFDFGVSNNFNFGVQLIGSEEQDCVVDFEDEKEDLLEVCTDDERLSFLSVFDLTLN